MQEQRTEQTENRASDVVEDLTLDEVKTESVKGGTIVRSGTTDSFSFGVEREMK